MSRWLATLLVIVVTAVALTGAASPPVVVRQRRLWMASILVCGCLAIAVTVWQTWQEGDDITALTGATVSAQLSHVERDRVTAADLARQVRALRDRVRELEE